MLNFYGMELRDEQTGLIGRGSNWKERYDFLNTSMHNFLRITRIIKCLGELGFDHYQAPFVEHVLTEITQHGQLRGLFKSARDYFSAVVRDPAARKRFARMCEDYARDYTSPVKANIANFNRQRGSLDARRTEENKAPESPQSEKKSRTEDNEGSTKDRETTERKPAGVDSPTEKRTDNEDGPKANLKQAFTDAALDGASKDSDGPSMED